MALVIVGASCASGSSSGSNGERGPNAQEVGSQLTRQVLEELEPEPAPAYESFSEIVDESGALVMEVPAAWGEVDRRSGPFGPDLRASTNLAEYQSTYRVPGAQLTGTAESTTGRPGRVLDELALRTSTDCDTGSRQPYEADGHRGVAQIFLRCGGGDSGFVWVAVNPSNGDAIAVLGVQILTTADVAALDHILATFTVDV